MYLDEIQSVNGRNSGFTDLIITRKTDKMFFKILIKFQQLEDHTYMI